MRGPLKHTRFIIGLIILILILLCWSPPRSFSKRTSSEGVLLNVSAGSWPAQAGTLFVGSEAAVDVGGTILKMLNPPISFTVTNTNDSGAGSLRQAILDANANSGTDTIVFNIPNTDPNFDGNVFTIKPTSGEFVLTDNGTTIDGSSQTTFTGNTNPNGPEVVVDGSTNSCTGTCNGFAVQSASNQIRNLVINNFTAYGVSLVGSTNTVADCYIGTNASLTARSANDAGVNVSSSGNTIDNNFISGNTNAGITLGGSGNTIRRNKIGVNPAANTSTFLHNGGHGIEIINSASNNTIGRSTSDPDDIVQFNGGLGGAVSSMGNIIWFNDGDGVSVQSGTGNALRGNAFLINGELGIDLAPNGVTGNDSGDADTGPNNLQNFPVLTAAVTNGSSITITGTLNSAASTTYAVEFFASHGCTSCGCDFFGNGEGMNYLGSTTVMTNASGNASINATLPGTIPAGSAITATATDPAGNTSEFSQCSASTPSPIFVVNSNADGNDNDTSDGVCNDGTGHCTLRAALAQAAVNPGTDTINFAIGSGPQTISVGGNGLPSSLTDPVIIDGTTQPGFMGTPIIELNGAASTSAYGIYFRDSSGNVVRGLVINRFLVGVVMNYGNNNVVEGCYIGTDLTGTVNLGGGGVSIDSSNNNRVGGTTAAARNVIVGGSFANVALSNNANGNTIEGNYIGTNAAGNASLGDNTGVRPFFGSTNNTIGGTAAGAGNVISGHTFAGIYDQSGGNTIQGNFIGTDATGTSIVGNSIGIYPSSGNDIIGGTASGAGNLISGNSTAGLELTSGNVVQGNMIGTNAAGTAALANGQGIALGGNGNTIGGTTAAARNVVSGNNSGGIVFLNDGSGNLIQGNSIYSNNGLGIDIDNNGVTPNDPGDADTGGNNRQNFPVLTSATSGGGLTTIRGTLNSTANTTFNIQFFSNAACDPSGNGEGQTLVGSTTVMTDASGNASFSIIFPTSVTVGQFITATATDPGNNTSEFSACWQVQSCAAITLSPTTLPSGALGTPYNQTITASGGTAPYTFTLINGNLPSGLMLSSGGMLTGTPTATGNFTFTVAATGANGCTGSRSYTLNIGVIPGSWSQQQSGTTENLRSVHFVNDNVGWAVGFNNTLLHTTNGGQNWSPQQPPNGAPLANYLAVRFVDANNGWAGAGRLVIRTTDGGATWANANADSSVFKFRNSLFAVSQTVAWAPANSSGLPSPTRWFTRYTAQGGGSVTEEDFNVIASGAQYLDIYFTDPDNGWAVGSSGPIVRITNASTGSPSFSFQTSGTSAQLNAIYMLDLNNGWVVGNTGTILKTTNGGSTWTPKTSGTTANLNDVHFINANIGWAVGAGGLILATADGGETWTPETSGVNTDLNSVFFATPGYAVGANGTILKRATTPPSIIISDAMVTEGNAGTTQAVFTVTLNDPAGPATVDYTTANNSASAGSDYVAANGTLNLSPATPTANISITVNGDTMGEDNEAFFVDLTNPTGATIADNRGQGAILNDDAAPVISITDAAGLEGNTGTRSLLFTIYMTGATNQPVTVNYDLVDNTANAGSDYVDASGTLTFNPGEITKTFPVTINGDTSVEADETFFVNLSMPVNATLNDGQAIGTITNDEGLPAQSATTIWRKSQEGMDGLNAVASNGSLYVVGTASGDIWTSPDTINWTKRVNPDTFTRAIQGLTFGGGQFVAVGPIAPNSGGLVLTSPDGINWTQRTIVARNLRRIAYGNGLYVATIANGQVFTSPDAITWTVQPTGNVQNLNGIAFGGGQFVAVGNNHTVLTSPDGINWTVRGGIPAGIPRQLNGVTYTGSQFVVVSSPPPGTLGAGVMTSPDGVVWTQQSVPTTAPLFGVASGGGQTVAVGTAEDANGTFLSSPDGINWTARAANEPGAGVQRSLRSVAYGPAGFLALGGMGGMYASPDGITNWTSHTLSTSRLLDNVAYNGTTFCAVGHNGTVLSSPDGVTWTQQSVPDHTAYPIWWSVTYANGLFVATGVSDSVMTSPNCSSWTVRNPTTPLPPFGDQTSQLVDVAYGNGLFVAVGETYPSTTQAEVRILTSPDAINWTPRTSGLPPTFRLGFIWATVAYGNGKFVAQLTDLTTGEFHILTSPDGINWTPQPAPFFDPFEYFDDITFANGMFVGVGDRIWTSPDGISWTLRLDYINAFFLDVAYGDGRFVAVGSAGIIYSSPDGQQWSPQAGKTKHTLNSIVYASNLNRFVAVGESAIEYTFKRNKPADFDGDGITDISVWQSDTGGKWHIINSADNSVRLQFWGQNGLGDQAVPGDYDGDGKTEIAIYRPSEGNFYIILSSTGMGLLQNWGGPGDRPVPADYDGDGRTDIAVYRPSEGNWYVLQSSGGSTVQGWGDPSDKLVPGDYDGDGRADVAIYRPTEGNWYVRKSTGGLIQQNWGVSQDRPVPGDYDGDGVTDFAVFRPSEGNWYIKKSTGGSVIRNWGDSTDKPIPGDYDGDGKDDIAVWRPSEGTWYLILSGSNTGAQRYLGGYSTDTPIPFAYLPQ